MVRESESAAGENLCGRRLGFVPLDIHKEHDDATSATIAGDGHLEWFLRSVRREALCVRKRSHSGNASSFRKENSFLTGESKSMIQTLISPHKLDFSNKGLNSDQTDRSIAIPPHPIARVNADSSFSQEATFSSSVEQRGYRSLYGTPGKNQEEGFRPLARTTTMNKELSSTSGHSPAYFSPPRKNGFTDKLTSNQRHFSNPSSPINGLRRNHSDLFRLVPESLSSKAMSAADLTLAPTDQRKAAVNPFRYAKAQGSQRLSNDRQRWSHLFPASIHSAHRASIDVTSEVGEPIFLGPNWTSLTSPAILPLTTDHIPSPHELRQGYTEAFYTLTIPTTAMQTPAIECVPRYRNHDELLIEMICQRLACDFQLVSTCDSTASLMGSEFLSPRSRRRVYHLSMGYRIHQLIYDAERQTVEVKRFVQREPHDHKVASISYNYSLWVGLTQSFQPHQQTFHRYPQPEDNWNALDNLLCGYLDDMADTMKCRRVRFAIVPPVLTTSSSGVANDSSTAYAAKFTKFIEFLQSRVAPSESGDLENIIINMVLERPEAIQKTDEVPALSENRMLSFKIVCKASSVVVSLSSASKFEDSRTEWVMIRLEETMDISRCFHLDVRWLACSGIAADEFVGAVRRRAKQSGLDLRRVPEYSSVSCVQIHPLIASVFLPLPATASALSKKPRLPNPRCSMRGHRRSPSTNARLMLERWQQRGYKQLIHRRVPVSVRIIHDGLIWIPGYDYERKVDGATNKAATKALFREVCTTIDSQCGDCHK
ncbi:unnamed protein product [Peronospora destructor]|uniref:Uncharacterized protein n=1 Tax=Peronospora destructor TaxID=86335 RepID=A0AAV0SUB5_9STRA|nr:unnamed protein product [Peronospora destructor]